MSEESDMRILFMIAVMWLPMAVLASNSYPVPQYLPDPVFPPAAKGDKYEDIVVRVIIRANGSVEFLEALSNVRVEYVDAIQQALKLWRFEPWMPPQATPDGEKVLITFHYSNSDNDLGSPAMDLNVLLKSRRCSKLNDEIAVNSRQFYPKILPHEAKVIRDTERYLREHSVIREFLSESQRQALITDLYDAVPGVIENCRNNPGKLYVEFLPEQVRKVL